MRTLAQVAAEPLPNDKVVMHTGHVRYDVSQVSGMKVLAVRTAVRSSPYQEESVESITRPAWWDLVTYGAVSLE
jgi:hypothetical protein